MMFVRYTKNLINGLKKDFVTWAIKAPGKMFDTFMAHTLTFWRMVLAVLIWVAGILLLILCGAGIIKAIVWTIIVYLLYYFGAVTFLLEILIKRFRERIVDVFTKIIVAAVDSFTGDAINATNNYDDFLVMDPVLKGDGEIVGKPDPVEVPFEEVKHSEAGKPESQTPAEEEEETEIIEPSPIGGDFTEIESFTPAPAPAKVEPKSEDGFEFIE